MVFTRSKLLALVIAVGYVVADAVTSGWDSGGPILICVILSVPLALIWFPDEIAGYSKKKPNELGGRYRESPAPVLTFLGWLGLLGYLPLLAYLLARK